MYIAQPPLYKIKRNKGSETYIKDDDALVDYLVEGAIEGICFKTSKGDMITGRDLQNTLMQSKKIKDAMEPIVITSYSIHYTKLYEHANFGKLSVPAQITDELKCWGGINHTDKDKFKYFYSMCSTQDRIFIDDKFVITSYSIHYTKLYDINQHIVGYCITGSSFLTAMLLLNRCSIVSSLISFDNDCITLNGTSIRSRIIIPSSESLNFGSILNASVITSYSIHYTKLYDAVKNEEPVMQ